ncbi:MAG: hypothetical protein AAF266_02935 [Planctomycetota bacterium]
MKKVHRRKSEFIDPEVQGALARRISVHWLLYTLVASGLVVGLKWMTNPFTPLTDHVVQAWWTYGPLLLVLVCLAPIFVFDAVKLSNRFTGPVLRLRNATRQLAAGERPGRIQLRDGDFWKELAEDFNRVVDRYKPEDTPAAERADC